MECLEIQNFEYLNDGTCPFYEMKKFFNCNTETAFSEIYIFLER